MILPGTSASCNCYTQYSGYDAGFVTCSTFTDSLIFSRSHNLTLAHLQASNPWLGADCDAGLFANLTGEALRALCVGTGNVTSTSSQLSTSTSSTSLASSSSVTRPTSTSSTTGSTSTRSTSSATPTATGPTRRPYLKRLPRLSFRRPPRSRLAQPGFPRPHPPLLLPRPLDPSASRALTPPTRTSRASASSPVTTDTVRPGRAPACRTAVRFPCCRRPAWRDTHWRAMTSRISASAALLITTGTIRRRLALLTPMAVLSNVAYS